MAAEKVIDKEWEFGRLDDDEELPDFTPKPFRLIGYNVKTKKEVAHTFAARGTQPFGATMDMFRKANDKGEITNVEAVRFIYDCLVEDDRERWETVIHDPDVHYAAKVLAQMAKKLLEFYGQGEGGTRPTQPRSARRSGPRSGGATSTVVHSGRVSTSSRSTPKKRSTSSRA